MKLYKKDKIQLQHNNKTGEAGTIDIFRGCPGCELKNAPCYAAKGAARTGIDFFQPVERELDQKLLEKQLDKYEISWVRIGCISDPSLDWNKTCKVSELVRGANKTPVIITKVYNFPSSAHLKRLQNSEAQVQISVCGVTPTSKVKERQELAASLKLNKIDVVWRIISALWKKDSKARKVQDELISFSRRARISVIDTPIRMFKTSPLWKLVDQDQYHRHLSPISGKLDNQKTAGLIIPYAYPCFSTCTDHSKSDFDPGCLHQCCTVM